MNRQMDGWTDRWTVIQWTDEQADERMDRQMDGWNYRWMNGQTDGQMHIQMDGRAGKLKNRNSD
jgi:hypothetical protein